MPGIGGASSMVPERVGCIAPGWPFVYAEPMWA